MTALLSILALLAAWALLATLEQRRWPPQQFDRQYWQSVLDNANAYLAIHSDVSERIRVEVERTINLAQRRLAR